MPIKSSSVLQPDESFKLFQDYCELAVFEMRLDNTRLEFVDEWF